MKLYLQVSMLQLPKLLQLLDGVCQIFVNIIEKCFVLREKNQDAKLNNVSPYVVLLKIADFTDKHLYHHTSSLHRVNY